MLWPLMFAITTAACAQKAGRDLNSHSIRSFAHKRRLHMDVDTNARLWVNPLEGVTPVAGRDSRSVMRDLPEVLQWALSRLASEVPHHNNSDVKCPTTRDPPPPAPQSTGKYFRRNYLGQCNSPIEMWKNDVSQIHRYKYNVVAELMGLRRGYRVLDWGAGCGHNLDLIAKERGFEGIAVDLVSANAEWGQQHLQHLQSFCAMNGANLTFPENTFDAVVSNAALYHMGDAQCTIVRDQILRVLRPGACAWFGWQESHHLPQSYWLSDKCCIGKEHVVYAVAEKQVFSVSEYNEDRYSLFVCKANPSGQKLR